MMYSNDKHDCPRGFSFSQEKGECVPTRNEVGDKLTQRYERFFFKEDDKAPKPIKGKTETIPACPEGYKW